MSVSTIDLNVDAGESFGAWTMGDDAALFAEVSSANLACGFHAGDPGHDPHAASSWRSRQASRSARIPGSPTCPASDAGRWR